MRRTEARSLAPTIHNMRLEMSKAASSSNADPAADLHAYLTHVGTPVQGTGGVHSERDELSYIVRYLWTAGM